MSRDHNSDGISPGQPVGPFRDSFPLEAAFGFIPIESGLGSQEVEHEIGPAVTVDIFNMAAVGGACAATVGEDVGGSEPYLPSSLVGSNSSTSLENGEVRYSGI